MITVEVIRLNILSLFGPDTNKFMCSEGSDELSHTHSLTTTITASLPGAALMHFTGVYIVAYHTVSCLCCSLMQNISKFILTCQKLSTTNFVAIFFRARLHDANKSYK